MKTQVMMKSRSTLSLTLSSSILPQSAGKRAELVLQLTFTRSAVKLPGKGYFEIKLCDYRGLEESAQGEIWSMRCPSA